MPRRIDGLSLTVAAIGGLLIYAGIKGYSVPHALQSFVQGKVPAGAAQLPITGSISSSSSSSSSGPAAPAPASGAGYSNAQVQQIWIMAGGDPARAAKAGCISAHEDASGDPSITSPNPDGGTNVGLWQIDTRGVGAGYTVAQLQNPVTNARLAIQGSNNGTDWSQWATAGDCGG